MSVSPLDMQTLYSNLKIIGQHHAAARSAELAQQDKQAEESARKSDADEHRVAETKDIETGVDKVDVDEEKKREGSAGKEKEQADEKDDKASEQNFYEDPDIGHNIDISG